MCGRFAQIEALSILAETFRIDEIITDLPPSYNVAPGQPIAAITAGNGKRILGSLTWGMSPAWQKKGAKPLINARSETVHEKQSFRGYFLSGRCLIPASGFYEWKKGEKGKDPVYISLSSRQSFAMAGLFQASSSTDSASCVILTTAANRVLLPLHDRMPVILPAGSEDAWLDPGSGPELLRSLFAPYADDEVRWHPVSPLVNSPRNNSPECIIPV